MIAVLFALLSFLAALAVVLGVASRLHGRRVLRVDAESAAVAFVSTVRDRPDPDRAEAIAEVIFAGLSWREAVEVIGLTSRHLSGRERQAMALIADTTTVVDTTRKKLRSWRPSTRLAAVDAMARLAIWDIELRNRLADSCPLVRWRSIVWAQRVGLDNRSTPIVANLIVDQDGLVRETAFDALMTADPQHLESCISTMVRKGHTDLLKAAVEVVKTRPEVQLPVPTTTAWRDFEPELRQICLELWSERLDRASPVPEGLDLVLSSIGPQSTPDVKIAAAEVLASLRPRQAISPLLLLTEDSDVKVCSAATEALRSWGRIGDIVLFGHDQLARAVNLGGSASGDAAMALQ